VATTRIKKITRNLKRATDYSLNPEKTELIGPDQSLGPLSFQSAFNCRIDHASEDMTATKERWNKPGKVLAYRIMQSFKPGEIAPELAHKIGVAFARRYLADRYDVVIGTHLDRAHVHNDICFNSVSYVDGGKFRNNFADYYQGIRRVSDELCREHDLSIVKPQSKGKPYREHMDEKAGKPTQNAFIKADIDAAIEASYTFQSFVDALKKKGYTVKYGPNVAHMTVKAPGAKRARRLDTLNDPRYTEDAIRARLVRRRDGEPEPPPMPATKPPRRYRAAGPLPRPRRKLTGFMALYYKYLYLLGAIRRKKAPGRVPYTVRADVIKLEKYRRQFLFLYQNGIETTAQLDAFQERATAQAEAITGARRPLYTERRNATDEEKKAALSGQIGEYTRQLRELRKDITMCVHIRDTAPAVRDNVRSAEETQWQERQKATERRQEKRPERKRPSL